MIPTFEKFLLPVLKVLSDGNEHSIQNINSNVAKLIRLTNEDMQLLVSSGTSTVFKDRVSWARTYLKFAGLIKSAQRGIFQITEEGRNILNENLEEITTKYLRKYPSFIEFQRGNSRNTTKTSSINGLDETAKNTTTPDEMLAAAYQDILHSLEAEILETLKSVSPSFFERIVVELLVKMGYGGSIAEAAKVTRYSNDEGIDGIIKEDKLGLDVIYIQAKRWEGVVGRPEIQKFVGALAGQRAKKGVFITTSSFTKEAIIYAAQMDTKIVLLDGAELASLMIDYNLGVSIQNVYEIKRIDSDYFEED
jgi:restriction system protein